MENVSGVSEQRVPSFSTGPEILSASPRRHFLSISNSSLVVTQQRRGVLIHSSQTEIELRL